MTSYIKLVSGQFGWDYLIVACTKDGDDIYRYNPQSGTDERLDQYIQSDVDYPSLATTFGWDGGPEENVEDIAAAQEYLDEHEGDVIEDHAGYFDLGE